jgi:hypothetical protein
MVGHLAFTGSVARDGVRRSTLGPYRTRDIDRTARRCLNAPVRLYDEFAAAVEKRIVPELQAIRADLREIREHVSWLRAELRPWRRDILAEVRRLEARIVGFQEELRRPISCGRARRRRRAE